MLFMWNVIKQCIAVYLMITITITLIIIFLLFLLRGRHSGFCP